MAREEVETVEQEEDESPTSAESIPPGEDLDVKPESQPRASESTSKEDEADGKEIPTAEETQEEQPEFVSIRDVAKKQAGFDPATWADDEAAANEIVNGYKQFREIEPDYELYRRMSPQFNAWLQQQQAPPPAQTQAEKKKWYQAPEFDQSWLNDLELDENQNLRPKAGRQVSPDRLNAVANYIQWRREVQEKLASNPQEAIKEIVSGHIEEAARKIAAEQVSELRHQNEAQQFVDRHASWLFRHNEHGQRVNDPISRKPVLTQEGQLFSQYFAQAEQLGLKTMSDMQDYALGMLERDILRSRHGQAAGQPAVPTGKKAVKEALTTASRSPKRAASQANPNEPGKMGQNQKADLGTQLLSALKEAGIKDDDLD